MRTASETKIRPNCGEVASATALRNRPLTDQEREERFQYVQERRAAGAKLSEISAELGVSGPALSKFLSRTRRPSRKKLGLIAVLRSEFRYDAERGQLIRLRGRNLKGAAIGTIGANGRPYAAICGKRYPLHHLVWAYHHGRLPQSDVLDHINRDPLDNRIENLREATFLLNAHNKSVTRKTVSGLRGAWPADGGRVWRSQIIYRGKAIWLGSHSSAEAAARAYDAKAIALFGADATTNVSLGLLPPLYAGEAA